MRKNYFLNELERRNLIKDITPYTKKILSDDKMIGGYIGFDPTAPSLHVGNLCAIMLLKHFQLAGHKPFVLLGGFTGGIGDPAGKKNERKLLNETIVKSNSNSLKKQFLKFLDFDCGKNSAEFVNNKDWLENLSLSEFLRDVGKNINVSYMISKDSVKNRLSSGLSFTEFTYQLFQAYDFYWLFKNKNCKLQMGGSDQWGNITGGVELIRKKLNKNAFSLTTHLLTKSDGGKFGKSEEGNVWLDPNLTSPYKFYQFWLNVDDSQTIQLLKIFTLLPLEEIERLEREYQNNPIFLKNRLAKEITVMVHSEEVFEKVKKASDLIYGKSAIEDFEKINDGLIEEVFHGLSKSEFRIQDLNSLSIDYVVSKVFGFSKAEAKRLISSNAISVNKQKISIQNMKLGNYKLLKNKYLIIQKGKYFGLAKFGF